MMKPLSRKQKINISRKSRLQFEPAKKTSPLILVISALEDTRALFSVLLPFWGYSVADAEKIDDCDKIFELESPALVLMDLPKSFASALADFKNLRRKIDLKQIPVILLSGYAQPQYRNEALENGADDFLVKPLDFDNLEEILQYHFSRRQKTLPQKNGLKLNLATDFNHFKQGGQKNGTR